MPISDDVRLGTGVRIFQPSLVNLYGCTIGNDTRIGAFVEIQKNATIGARCKISSHSFLCEGVSIDDEVFIGLAGDSDARPATRGDRQQCVDRRRNHGGRVGAGRRRCRRDARRSRFRDRRRRPCANHRRHARASLSIPDFDSTFDSSDPQ